MSPRLVANAPGRRSRSPCLRRPAAGYPAALDSDADGLPAARLSPLLRSKPVGQACARALELDVIDVTKIARRLDPVVLARWQATRDEGWPNVTRSRPGLDSSLT
jgi:hypothetical protein